MVLAPWVKLREAVMKASANGQGPQEGGDLMGGSVFLTLLPLWVFLRLRSCVRNLF